MMMSDMSKLIIQIKATRWLPTELPRLVAGLIIWDTEKLVIAVPQAECWMRLPQAPGESSSRAHPSCYFPHPLHPTCTHMKAWVFYSGKKNLKLNQSVKSQHLP